VEGSKALAAVLPQTKIISLSLANNSLTNEGEDMAGVLKLAEALPQTEITELNLRGNDLDDKAKRALEAAVSGRGVELNL